MTRLLKPKIASRLAITFFIVFMLCFVFFGAIFYLQMFVLQKKRVDIEKTVVMDWFDHNIQNFVIKNNHEKYLIADSSQLKTLTRNEFEDFKNDSLFQFGEPDLPVHLRFHSNEVDIIYKIKGGDDYMSVAFKTEDFWNRCLESFDFTKGYVFRSHDQYNFQGAPYLHHYMDHTIEVSPDSGPPNRDGYLPKLSITWLPSGIKNQFQHSLYQLGRLESVPTHLTLGYLFESHLYLGVLGILFIMVFLYRYLWKFITLPIEQLKSAVSKASLGDLTAKSNLLPEGEIGELGYQFDQMIQRLKESKEKLELLNQELKHANDDKDAYHSKLLHLNKNLESLVSERTDQILTLKNFYEKILHDLTTGIAVVSPVGQIRYCNPFASKYWQVNASEESPHFKNFNIPEALKDVLGECLKKHCGTDNVEVNHLSSATGQNNILGAKITPLFNKEQFDGLIIMFQDITRRKQFEKELLQTERVAKVALFASGMAHDTNNILNRIKIGVNIISKKISAGIIDVEEYLEEINGAISEGQNYTRSLVNVAQTENPLLEKTDINLALSNFAIKHSLYFPNIKIELSPLEEIYYIKSNERYLMQIFNNLFANSSSAIGEGEGQVVISLKKLDQTVKITFKDDGPGIHPEVVPYLFVPFHYLKSTPRQKGMGMGLAFIKFLAESLNGQIQLNYTGKDGTIFILEFPLWKEK